MLIVTGYMHVKPTGVAGFRTDIQALAFAKRQRDGNLSCDAAVDDPLAGMLLVVERWRDQAALAGPDEEAAQQSGFGVLPALVDELEALAVRIEDVGGVVPGTVAQSGTRRSSVGGACSYGGCVGGIDIRLRGGDEADIDRTPLRDALAQPQEHAPFGAKPLEVRVTRWAILAVVIMPVGDPKRG